MRHFLLILLTGITFLMLSPIQANEEALEDWEINQLTLITKHGRCYHLYRGMFVESAAGKLRLGGDDQLVAAEQMAKHLAIEALNKDQLSAGGHFYEANLAGLRGEGTYRENWDEIPDPDGVSDWAPSVSSCARLL
jgi:hypothetical protein